MEKTREFSAEAAAGETAGTIKDLSKYVPEARRKPGELGMAAITFLLGALGYYFALDMTSGEYSSPSVFPKLASTLIMACSAFNFYKALRKEKREASVTLTGYLLPMDVVVVLVLLVAYCFILPRLHFVASSYAFMVIGMVYLQRGKNIIRALLISAVSLAVLVAVFRYLFLVILP
ncbi:MAG: tripartite tricarboxylate transporter TctB family protein [Synergistaceae bacterium]|jgi:putative tricarboxylic transport membrane protein|uniref:tripartite tricarboxylate transporter TctB family protein n=1 Tax=Aminivibrio sp. TaxID=1872489 RepID=UPI0018285BEF|nr:tripartite tricarboxylate transporter TctB family protein [Synergistaceae bacterium]MDD4612808.1 tripartite tricarboxylate transporter TctB family protein [Synergistaceae bacterium]NCC58159.1 tripartite tricarboxylate transporter TctB family protein [Synergistales bacterium]HHX58969.1 tripartite tricarboxylate transporter TctB family protein [Candidatus Moranbacteria bacterium]